MTAFWRWVSAAQPLLEFLTATASVAVAALVYRFSRQQWRESWLRAYQELHETFWTDSAIREVRSWLAPGAAYEMIRPVLEKRRMIEDGAASPATLSHGEYLLIEKLDRFLNFLVRVDRIGPEVKDGKTLARDLYFEYWLRQLGHADREELRWYVTRFYPKLNQTLDSPQTTALTKHAS